MGDLGTFPRAFVEGRIGGEHAAQHTSDLVRFPLLLRYGGVYAVSFATDFDLGFCGRFAEVMGLGCRVHANRRSGSVVE